MWPMTQYGFATTTIEFTGDLSPLIIGLVGLLGLSAGFIIFAALQERWSQKTELMQETHASENRRDAA